MVGGLDVTLRDVGSNGLGGEQRRVGGEQRRVGGDFPGGPMAKTPCSQSQGPGTNPWSGN